MANRKRRNKPDKCCYSCTGRASHVADGHDGSAWYQCEHCGYAAPEAAFGGAKSNAAYRLNFDSAIFAEKAEDAEMFLRKCMQEHIEDCQREVEELIAEGKKRRR